MPDDYLEVNRANWDSRAPIHAEGYGIERYVNDPTALSDVVRFDLPRLGDIAGREVVHLQCHIGTDTLSLHRLGAHVTGVDLSGVSLSHARHLAAEAGAHITYVESDVTRLRKRWAARTTSSTPASARSAGCRASPGGPRRSLLC